MARTVDDEIAELKQRLDNQQQEIDLLVKVFDILRSKIKQGVRSVGGKVLQFEDPLHPEEFVCNDPECDGYGKAGMPNPRFLPCRQKHEEFTVKKRQAEVLQDDINRSLLRKRKRQEMKAASPSTPTTQVKTGIDLLDN